MSNINFSGEGIHVLASFMYACPCVERLHCRSCGITSDDLKQLLELISELRLKFSTPLTFWILIDNDISDDGVSALIQHLSMFPKLRCIFLDSNIRVGSGMLKTLKEKLDAQRVRLHCSKIYCIDLESSCVGTRLFFFLENPRDCSSPHCWFIQ